MNAPEILSPNLDISPTGRTPDYQVMGYVLLACMVIYINMKLMADAQSITIPMTMITVLSVLSLFGLTYKHFPKLLTEVTAYPQIGLCLVLLALSVWPSNYVFYQRQHTELKEVRALEIQQNTHRREKQRRELMEIDLEERTQILKMQLRESMRPSLSNTASHSRYT
jgi:hypothetical protein